MKDEGYIKFECQWKDQTIDIPEEYFEKLNHWRNILLGRGLIGVDIDRISYGNISMRFENTNQFFITGSGTGDIRKFGKVHYAKVTAYDFEKNLVKCEGKVHASSESLSHAVIYEDREDINAVIHVHHSELWESLKGNAPTTSDKMKYGTPEMAEEISQLLKKFKISEKKLIIVGGHEDGIITFGKSINEAGNILLYFL